MKSLIALLKPIERLIREHGSASIQRDHLALLKTQASILEKENADLKSEIDNLRDKIQKCENRNKKLKEIILNLKNKLSQKTPPLKSRRNWIKNY